MLANDTKWGQECNPHFPRTITLRRSFRGFLLTDTYFSFHDSQVVRIAMDFWVRTSPLNRHWAGSRLFARRRDGYPFTYTRSSLIALQSSRVVAQIVTGVNRGEVSQRSTSDPTHWIRNTSHRQNERMICRPARMLQVKDDLSGVSFIDQSQTWRRLSKLKFRSRLCYEQ